MENCLKCTKGLSGATKSAVKEDGSFYLSCNSCGNVMYVTKDATTGLTTIHATLEGAGQDVKDQMIEAKKLFILAGKGITQYIDTMNGEKKAASDLVEKEVINYDDVKETVVESVKDLVKSIGAAIGVKGIDVYDGDAEQIADLIVDQIKGAEKNCCECTNCTCK